MKMPHPFSHTGNWEGQASGREPGTVAWKVCFSRASCPRCVGNAGGPRLMTRGCLKGGCSLEQTRRASLQEQVGSRGGDCRKQRGKRE